LCFEDNLGNPAECPNAGGGEFVLRHDRTKFAVSGSGDKSANGIYSSVPKNHDLFFSDTYDGVPIYKQVCGSEGTEELDNDECGNHIMAQLQIGVQKFWIITDVPSLISSHHEFGVEQGDNEAAFAGVKYSAWSEEVTPPNTGWRIRGHEDGRIPAPMVNPVVSSMYELEAMAHPLTLKTRGGGYVEAAQAAVGNVDADILHEFGFLSIVVIVVVVAVLLYKGNKNTNGGLKRMSNGGRYR